MVHQKYPELSGPPGVPLMQIAPIVAGALIGGGLGLIGNYLGGQQQREAVDSANAANREMNAANNAQNERLQREFAQNGIRWRVEDAKAAGLHPLAALGAAGASGPVMTAGQDIPNTASGEMMSRMGETMGQNVSRAVSSTSTAEEQQIQKLQIANAQLELEGKALDNQYRLAQLNQLSKGPAFPGSDNFMPGQGNSGLVKVNPAERSTSAPGRPAQEAGWVPDVGYARTDTGLTPVPSQNVKERIEDQIVPETMWALRNQLAPNFTDSSAPPKSMLPKGATHWQWSYSKQEWQPRSGQEKSFKQWWKEKGGW